MSDPPPIPFLRPSPPRLSRLVPQLEAIEASGTYSNYGPVNASLEAALSEQLFGGLGRCLAVSSATSGLMLAIREAAPRGEGRRYALMPSFTFAAAAHAAIWAGLTPLLCDIDPLTWSADPDSEDELLERHAGRIACIVPYASFGSGLDLDRYARLARERGLGVVVDAAGSLGSLDSDGRGFGAGFPHALVYSMHVTKAFATGEAGVIQCGDGDRIDRLRAMGNFGFDDSRSAVLPGLNAKLSEVGALIALARIDGFEDIVAHRESLATAYRAALPGLQFQHEVGRRLARQFMPAMLPSGWGARRPSVLAALEQAGVSCRTYFSPHLAQQPYFAAECIRGPLPVTEDVASRVMSLPLADGMTIDQVARVARALLTAMHRVP